MVDLPLLCSKCLGKSLKLTVERDLRGRQCTLCTRPFASFAWRKHNMVRECTRFCGACAAQHDCCQCCYRHFATGLPFAVHQAAGQRAHATPQLLKHAAVTAQARQASEVSRAEYERRLNQKLVEFPSSAGGASNASSTSGYAKMLALLSAPIATEGSTFLLANIDPALDRGSLERALGLLGGVERLSIEAGARCGFVEFTHRLQTSGVVLVDGHRIKLVAAEPFELSGAGAAEISLLVQRFARGTPLTDPLTDAAAAAT